MAERHDRAAWGEVASSEAAAGLAAAAARPLGIGISARIHPPVGSVFDLSGVYTQTLHFIEQSVAHRLPSCHVLAVMIQRSRARA